MALHHLGLAKIVALGSMAVGAIVIAMDPSVKAAYIMSGGVVLASLPALILGILNRRTLTDTAVKVDGILSKAKQDEKAATSRADHAEGFRAGSESERITETKGE